MKIRITIDRLVLEGFSFSAKEREAIRSSVEAEFMRLIRAGGVPPSMRAGGAVESIAAPPIRAERTAAKTGEGIAQSRLSRMGAE